jgi:hypothetical protein
MHSASLKGSSTRQALIPGSGELALRFVADESDEELLSTSSGTSLRSCGNDRAHHGGRHRGAGDPTCCYGARPAWHPGAKGNST